MMNNISAVRSNSNVKDASSCSDSEEEEEYTPWPEHELDHRLSYSRAEPTVTSATGPDSVHYPQTFEWSNRSGQSRIHRELPRDQQHPLNIYGRTPKEASANFPEPEHDYSSEEELSSHFPDPRHTRSRSSLSQYNVSNERHTQSSGSPIHHSMRSSVPKSLHDQPSYDFVRENIGSSRDRWQTPGESDDAAATDASDDGSARGKKRLFTDAEQDAARKYLTAPVVSPLPSSEFPSDMSAKVKGKQRSYEDVDDTNAQMLGLHLEIGHGRTTTTQGIRNSKDAAFTREDSGSTYHENKHADSADRLTRKSFHKHRDTNDDRAGGRSRNASSRASKRPVDSDSDSEGDGVIEEDAPSSTKPSGKKRKVNRYSCPVPLCKETFTRRNDVRRHIKNAAVHRDSPEALALLGEAVGTGTRCKFCNADLSRSDARMRHERASACGKRTTQKMKDQMLVLRT